MKVDWKDLARAGCAALGALAGAAAGSPQAGAQIGMQAGGLFFGKGDREASIPFGGQDHNYFEITKGDAHVVYESDGAKPPPDLMALIAQWFAAPKQSAPVPGAGA